MIKAAALIELFRKALADGWGYIWGTSGEKWTKARQEAIEKTTDSDRAQARKYGSKWIGHMVADCSGLFKWAFKKLGGDIYHGSDTMYCKWCTDKGELKKGKRSDGKTLKPGTAVFVWNGKKYSHVGLYVGSGLVIEAMGTLQGVTTSKVTATKWTNWGELKGVSYSSEDAQEGASDLPDDKLPTEALPTLKRGSKGEYVTLLQTKLANLGYDLGSCGVDGEYGKATEAAVKKFQKDHGLTADGVTGKKTWAALQDGTPMQYYTVIVSHLSESQAKALAAMYTNAEIEKEVG